MHTIAVYGSLKKGRYNHHLLETAKFLGNTTVRGTLYSMGSYPALVEEGDNSYPAEVYEVDDEFYTRIRGMELGAGYKEVEVNCGELVGMLEYSAIVYYADTELAEYCKQNQPVINSY
jgi:gamma-glutamylcyclotransferase (GGCT)/AIG2-like uncharacterized protein YtfP